MVTIRASGMASFIMAVISSAGIGIWFPSSYFGCGAHIVREPAFMGLTQRLSRDMERFSHDNQCSCRHVADPMRKYAYLLPHRSGLHDSWPSWLAGQHIAGLVLAEQGCGVVQHRRSRDVAPMPDASAISASAGTRPPSEMSCTAVAWPLRINSRGRNRRCAFRARSTGGGGAVPRGRASRADRSTGRDACRGRRAAGSRRLRA